jgi:thiol-disulfide isomerase/thioredoxin
MRSLAGVFVGVGLLLVTSCSTSQSDISDVQVADAPSSSSQSNRAEPSVHSHADGHRGHGEEHHANDQDGEPASNHEHAHVSHRGDAHSHTGDQHGEHDHSSAQTPPHGHGHSVEDKDVDNSKRIAVGDKVPDFEVSINGKKWMLSELQKNAKMTKDGTLVLTFWCSFCHSCRDVEHHLDELAKRYKGEAGVVALDSSVGETSEGVAEFAQEQGLTLPIALDSTGAAADVFGVRVTTTTVVIDGEGVLRYCGQFGDGDHTLAEDALIAVLAGEEVAVKKTLHKG